MSQLPPPVPPGPPPFRPGPTTPRHRTGPLAVVAVAVVVVIAAVAVVIGLRGGDDSRPAAEPLTAHSAHIPVPAVSVPPMPSPPPVPPATSMPTDAAIAMNLAEKFAVALNTYGPRDLANGRLGAYEDRVRPLLTPRFLKEFDKNLGLAATTVRQTGADRTATPLGAGVERVDGGEITVLVSVRVVTSYDGRSSTPQVSHLEVTTEQQQDRSLLVDQMATAGATPPTGIPAPTGLAPAADEAVLAASQAAPVLLGYDYRTISSWRSRVTPLVTPTYLPEYAKTIGVLIPNATKAQTVVTVRPLAFSVRTLATDRVEVFAYLDRPTSNGTGKSTDFRDGVILTMVRTDGRWLVDDIASEGQ